MGNTSSSPEKSSSSSRRSSSKQPETTSDKAKKVVEDFQHTFQKSLRSLDDNHPAAQMIDTLCGPVWEDDKLRQQRSYAYSEDMSEEDSRTVSEDDTMSSYGERRAATKNARKGRSTESQSVLSTSDYESGSAGPPSSKPPSSRRNNRPQSDSFESEDDSSHYVNNKKQPVDTNSNANLGISKPLASAFAKRCYFTKAGIGKTTQHYEGLTLTGNVVLMLAAAMKLKGCPTICDEDLRRVEQTYPNQFSRLPDELLLSSGWRRISKYCHFSNKPIPDGVPFFHSKLRMHPSGGYFFLLAAAVGMVRPIDVEPLTRDTLVLLETDFSHQCDAAPAELVNDPNCWTLVDKFCFFSGGPINTEEDVYYQADFNGNPIFMLAFLSPSLTPEELYKLGVDNTDEPGLKSVAAVGEVESVYDLTDRDFDDLKLYHLGPCRALPPYILQPQAWSKVLPPQFLAARHRALMRAQRWEDMNGPPMHPSLTAMPPMPPPSETVGSEVASYGYAVAQYPGTMVMPGTPQTQGVVSLGAASQLPTPPMSGAGPPLLPNGGSPARAPAPAAMMYNASPEAAVPVHVPQTVAPPQGLQAPQQNPQFYGPQQQSPQASGGYQYYPPHPHSPATSQQYHSAPSSPQVNTHAFQREVEEEGAFVSNSMLPMDEAVAQRSNTRPPPSPSRSAIQMNGYRAESVHDGASPKFNPPEDEPPSLSRDDIPDDEGLHSSPGHGPLSPTTRAESHASYYSSGMSGVSQVDQATAQSTEGGGGYYREGDYYDSPDKVGIPPPQYYEREEEYYDSPEHHQQRDYDHVSPHNGAHNGEYGTPPPRNGEFFPPSHNGDYGTSPHNGEFVHSPLNGEYYPPMEHAPEPSPHNMVSPEQFGSDYDRPDEFSTDIEPPVMEDFSPIDIPPDDSPKSAPSVSTASSGTGEYSQTSAMRTARDLLKKNRQKRLEAASRRQQGTEDENVAPQNDGNTEWESSSEMTSVISGSSVWTDSSNPNDRSSRRALILQMAKARMRQHKPTDTTPIHEEDDSQVELESRAEVNADIDFVGELD